ncbi:MAG TPA: hypothetical protein VIW03_16180 [Anaeromyxobacter sp.]
MEWLLVTVVTEAALAFVLGATLEVGAGQDLAQALARARPGDVVRLGAGEHRAALGRRSGIAVEGAGAGTTVVVAPEGEDGLVATGEVILRGLTLRAGAGRCGLKVMGGTARLEDVALSGGACGAFVDGGRVDGRAVELRGEYGLLLRAGRVSLDGGSARAWGAGIGLLGGEVALRRYDIVGPAREAGISVAGGTLALEAVTLRAPGPSGIAISANGRVDGAAVTIAGAVEHQGFLGDCIQVRSGALRLAGATLVGCAGAAVEASGGDVSLRGVDATGGAAGCLVFVDGAEAALEGNLCAGRGPGLVLASGAHATAVANRWWTDPVLWVDCGSGARVKLGRGETAREPCAAPR